MARTRAIATAVLLAAIALTACTARQSDQPARPAETTPHPTLEGLRPPPPSDDPVVLADGRHPVQLKTVDPGRGTITFDLVQWYHGEDAAREAAKDHQESPPPNDYYVRNVNPKLRTLPTAAGATVTVNNLLSTQQSVPVSLAKLASLTRDRSPMFWITVRHDQVQKISEQWVP